MWWFFELNQHTRTLMLSNKVAVEDTHSVGAVYEQHPFMSVPWPSRTKWDGGAGTYHADFI